MALNLHIKDYNEPHPQLFMYLSTPDVKNMTLLTLCRQILARNIIPDGRSYN